MRQIALDTETTGLSTLDGHRIIEIGCIEFIDRRLTGNNFHCYINPGREIDAGALAVHGISNLFLNDKPTFDQILHSFVEYVDGAELIIHNAAFDVGFLNYEFSLVGHNKILYEHCSVFDTLTFARQKHPGQKNSLDALCKRYNVDNTHRNLHGALLDAELLAKVYLAMTGGQGSLFVEGQPKAQTESQDKMVQLIERNKPLPVLSLTEQEEQAHKEFLEILKKTHGNSVWEE